jgi:hypothetical protein
MQQEQEFTTSMPAQQPDRMAIALITPMLIS